MFPRWENNTLVIASLFIQVALSVQKFNLFINDQIPAKLMTVAQGFINF